MKFSTSIVAVAIMIGGMSLASVSLFAAPPPLQENRPVNEGLVGYWQFEGNANDVSGNNNHGILAGAPVFVPGKIGQGLNMIMIPGGGHVRVSDSDSLEFAGPFTLMAWIRAAGGNQDLIYKWGPGGNAAYRLSIEQSTSHIRIRVCTHIGDGVHETTCASSENVASDVGDWHHVAAVFANNQYLNNGVEFYLDGEHVGTGGGLTSTMTTDDRPVLLGPGLRGVMDEVRIYSRAVSAQEIFTLYKSQANRQ